MAVPEAAAVSGEMVHGRPAVALRGSVLSYTGYAERTAAPLRRLEAPTVRLPMILSLGPAILVDGVRHTSFAAGLYDTAVVTEHAGEQLGVEVALTPLGARRLLGMPMAELTRQVVGLEALLGAAGAAWPARLADASSWPARFALLDDLLAQRLAGARPLAPELLHAWSRLEQTGGNAGIAQLAQEVGWSRRHLAARFGAEVGMGPKAVARILRFERVTDLLRAGSVRPGGLAGIAYACGYADQAHLNRDFRAFADTTPTDFLRRLAPDGAGVAA